MKLVIGNKNYSSWSLRAWFMLAGFDLPFEEIRIPLSTPDTAAAISQYSAAGRVPVLLDGEITVWDSLAICEYISETFLSGQGWPNDRVARAKARSYCAEMHSGFFALRGQLPMNCRAHQRQVAITEELQRDIDRVDAIWSECIREHSSQGPWLFGSFSIADCMFAPVAMRFASYNPPLSTLARQYVQTVLDHPRIKLWQEQAKAETEIIPAEEVGLNDE